MKQSHFTTPRTLNECHFTPGYVSHSSQDEPLWERIAGYVLVLIIGVGLATVLFYGWSK